MVRSWNHKQLIFTVSFPKTCSPVVTFIPTWHTRQIKSQQLLILEFYLKFILLNKGWTSYFKTVLLLLLTLYLHIIGKIYKCPSFLPQQNRIGIVLLGSVQFFTSILVFPYHLPFMKTLSYVHVSILPEITAVHSFKVIASIFKKHITT